MKKKSSAQAEVTFTLRGASLPAVLKKISDPSKPALERAQAQLNGLGQQIAAMERELGAARMSEGDARAQALEAVHRAEALEQRIDDALSAMREPFDFETLKAYLEGTRSAPRWSHLCSKANDRKTPVRRGEKCAACGVGEVAAP